MSMMLTIAATARNRKSIALIITTLIPLRLGDLDPAHTRLIFPPRQRVAPLANWVTVEMHQIGSTCIYIRSNRNMLLLNISGGIFTRYRCSDLEDRLEGHATPCGSPQKGKKRTNPMRTHDQTENNFGNLRKHKKTIGKKNENKR